MMDLHTEGQPLWKPEELGAILEHQLAAPVAFDLGALDSGLNLRLQSLTPAGPPLNSFRDLFHHPQPPLELLLLTKDFAKRCHYWPDSPIPDEIASVLYLLAIVVAMTRCHRAISRLDNKALRYSLDWALSQSWLDDSTRTLLRDSGKTLGVM
jgi:hypothetical protein